MKFSSVSFKNEPSNFILDFALSDGGSDIEYRAIGNLLLEIGEAMKTGGREYLDVLVPANAPQFGKLTCRKCEIEGSAACWNHKL